MIRSRSSAHTAAILLLLFAATTRWAAAQPGTPARDRPASPGRDRLPATTLVALPLSFGVAAPEGKPVVDAAWLASQLAVANRILAAGQLRLRRLPDRPLPAAHARLETRADRDALLEQRLAGAINVFVVASLRDVDDPRFHRLGVHWRPRQARHRSYVILVPGALPTTLAHELGHLLGNGHVRQRGNLMSYAREGDQATLTAAQIRRLRQTARSLLRALAPRAILPRSGENP